MDKLRKQIFHTLLCSFLVLGKSEMMSERRKKIILPVNGEEKLGIDKLDISSSRGRYQRGWTRGEILG